MPPPPHTHQGSLASGLSHISHIPSATAGLRTDDPVCPPHTAMSVGSKWVSEINRDGIVVIKL